jgi:hypothetical protein
MNLETASSVAPPEVHSLLGTLWPPDGRLLLANLEEMMTVHMLNLIPGSGTPGLCYQSEEWSAAVLLRESESKCGQNWSPKL